MADPAHAAPQAPPDPTPYLTEEPEPPPLLIGPDQKPLWQRILLWFVPNLTAFVASFCIMVLELVAGRIIARYLGSSLYTWTSVIGIVLAGITLGNLTGGRLADWFRPASVLSVLFLLAASACLAVPLLNRAAEGVSWGGKAPEELSHFVRSLHYLFGGEAAGKGQVLHVPWSAHIFGHVLIVFLLPSTVLGAIGPVVAKMALDQGRETGRTVGNVYAWGALGSIAGTFTTGFYLTAKFGSYPVILTVGMVLFALGIIFLLSRLVSRTALAGGVASFLGIYWAFYVPLVVLAALVGDWGLLQSKELPYEWIERDDRTVLRERGEDNTVYVDESDYSYIQIQRETKKVDGEHKEVKRVLHLDNLIHAYIDKEEPQKLQYDYEDIYKTLSHKFAPPQADQRGKMASLFMGGGGYVFQRYIRAKWPESHIEVAEIDPAVTAADIAAFFLDDNDIQIVSSPRDLDRTDNPMWVYHMDARNRVEDLVKQKAAGMPVPEFDFVYGDAFNFLSPPFHLTTFEFNEKVKKLMKPGSGVYMINVIDIFDSDKDPKEPGGEFLGAVYNTFRESFGDNVYVISCTETSGENPGGVSKSRDTYIVVGSLRPLDLSGLPGEDEQSRFSGTVLTKDYLDILTDDKHAGRLVLTDDFAPVEYLLRKVVQRWMW